MIRLVLALRLPPLVASAQQGFQSPSGNIFRHETPEAIRCGIARRCDTPPPSRHGAFDDGGGAALSARCLAEGRCASDTVADPGLPVLRHGTAWRGKGVSCTVSENGVCCDNPAGRGFQRSRALRSLFRSPARRPRRRRGR